ncbi:transaldolase family protein [Paraburkholderia sp. SIMBA_027]|uniref:transaldolase family protein n=1 Tax=Paraburkholderia sp. SIMBA_027 TaxID=3085770 RepID=UPI00397E827A
MFWRLYKAVLADAALSLRGLWEVTDGKYGWVSAQVDPRDVLNSEHMYHQGLELASLGPNVMVKVPGTAAGYDAIEKLVENGISINSTFSYTVPQVRCCLRAIDAGLRRRRKEPARWRSVITYMIGRFGAQGDLIEQASARGLDFGLADVRWAEVLVFRNMLQEIADSGVPAKLLLSSIKADVNDNDGATTCWHLEKTAGTPVVYTLTPTLLKTLLDAKYCLPPKHVPMDLASIEDVPTDLYERLLSLPYFMSASRADGMSAEAFHHQGAFITTAAEACASIRRMHDFIARAFQARHWSQPKTYASPLDNTLHTGVLGEAA